MVEISLVLAYLAPCESSPWRIVFDMLPNCVAVVLQFRVYVEDKVTFWYEGGQAVHWLLAVIATVIDFGGAQSIADSQKCFGTEKRYGELICAL